MMKQLLFVLVLFLSIKFPTSYTLSPQMDNILAVLNGNVMRQTRLTAQDPDDMPSQDYFGLHVSISGDGNIALIGAAYDDTPAGVWAGSAYVYRRSSGVWSFETKLTASDGSKNDLFGIRVALSDDGTTAVIGASDGDSPTIDNTGTAYIFTYDGTGWVERTKITALDGTLGDSFGEAVAVSDNGSTVLVGAWADSPLGGQSGSAYIFAYNGVTWVQQSKLVEPNGGQHAEFASAVALSGNGNIALIGSKTKKAYLYTRSGATWTLGHTFSGTGEFDLSVGLNDDGTTVILGDPNDSVSQTIGRASGAAYIYKYNGSSWIQEAKVKANDWEDYDLFGSSVSLSADGNTALIGERAVNGNGIGGANVFTRNAGVWTQQAKLLSTSANPKEDRFGISVELSTDGTTAFIGAPYDADLGTYNGAVYAFTGSGTSWSMQQKFVPMSFPGTIVPDGAYDNAFGTCLSLSKDGNTALVGAALGDSFISGNRGTVYIYTRSNNIWTIQAKLFVSRETGSSDFCLGTLSADGNLAFIGSQGALYIFKRNGTTWTEHQKLIPNGNGTPNGTKGRPVVSANGDIVFISWHQSNNPVYVFTRSGEMWIEHQVLFPTDPSTFRGFGQRMALSADGHTALIAAYVDDTAAGVDTGSVYVFTYNGDTWVESQKLVASDAAPNDQLGLSLALSEDGNTALIGAEYDDSTAGMNAGSAYIFIRNGNMWTQQQKLEPNNADAYDGFGSSVSLSGNTAIIMAPGDDTVHANETGSAYIFTYGDNLWRQQMNFTGIEGPADPFSNRYRHGVLSANGNTFLIGAREASTDDDTETGAADVFVLYGTTITETDDSTLIIEGGATDNYLLGLLAEPFGDAMITADPDDQCDLGAGAGTAVNFLFTPADYAEKSITVTVVNDSVFEGTHTCTIQHSVKVDGTTDSNYLGLAINSITVSITDNDTLTPTFTAVAPTLTATSMPHTETHTAEPVTPTGTAVSHTLTFTPIPHTKTHTAEAPTATGTTIPSTPTDAAEPDTPTQTHTSQPETATFTPIPPTETAPELLSNSGFEVKKPDSRPDLAPWVGAGLSTDKVRCNKPDRPPVAYDGDCAFVFKGGLNETARLIQKIDGASLTLSGTNGLVFSGQMRGGSAAAGKIKIRAFYHDTSAVGKLNVPLTATSGYQLIGGAIPLASNNVRLIKVQINHRSLAGKVIFDELSIKIVPWSFRE